MEYIKAEGEKCTEATQYEQKGTAHAVMMAMDFLEAHKDDDVLILGGDNPFMDDETIKKCKNADICVVGSFITKNDYDEALRKLRD